MGYVTCSGPAAAAVAESIMRHLVRAARRDEKIKNKNQRIFAIT